LPTGTSVILALGAHGKIKTRTADTPTSSEEPEMTIYTRRGDEGKTSLADGSRVSKASARLEAYGTVDEANSAVGVARASTDDHTLGAVLDFVQQRLFNCSSSLATPVEHRGPETPIISSEDVTFLEQAVDRFEETTGGLDHFIVETGSPTAAQLQLARAVVRRAERRVVTLAAEEAVDAQVMAFINRLSDTLFAAARYANAVDDRPEVAWDPHAERPAI
jgi:cob(I)alamin adenosyltransferase